MNYITKLCISLYCISIINAQVSGIVVDAYSEQRIEGVNITSESTGTTTNADGEFQLDVNERSILQFSHIGYHTIKLTAINEMVVKLEEKVIDTEEGGSIKRIINIQLFNDMSNLKNIYVIKDFDKHEIMNLENNSNE